MKRYDMFAVNDGYELQECDGGEWVRFEDHVAALTEATALLERVEDCYADNEEAEDLVRDAHAFLRRAPAQPAAPTPRRFATGAMPPEGVRTSTAQSAAPTPVQPGFCYVDMPPGIEQPAAPTPEPRWLTDAEETALFPDGDPDPFEQPAAPEPSADRVAPAMLAEFEMGKDQRNRLRAALESAEAQLAAVRTAVQTARTSDGNNPHWKGWEPILAALTPAPSSGAGEKT